MLKSLLAAGIRTGSTAVSALNTQCAVCSGPTRAERAYGRAFRVCVSESCGFAACPDMPEWVARRGMGLSGSWGGLEVGGQREDFLVRLLSQAGVEHFLLVGVGATRCFRVLRNAGFKVEGCDVSRAVIDHWRKEFGDAFFHVDEIASRMGRYDAVIACEVIEHWIRPRHEFARVMSALRPNGSRVFAGTTDMRPAGALVTDEGAAYMSHWGHQSYWSEGSLRQLTKASGLSHFLARPMLAPGMLTGFPRKRLFFASASPQVEAVLNREIGASDVVQLDTRNYRPEYV